MSQHDYDIANGGGAAVRADINSALAAIRSQNSGTTEPASPVAGMLWYDTLNGALKQRNSANTAWVAAAEFIAGGPLAGLRNRIINGNFDVWQRGTSFANPASIYTADRWFCAGTSSTLSQVTGASGFGKYAAAFVATAATNSLLISQALESFTCETLKGKRVTFSFAFSASSNQPSNSLVISVQRNGTADTQTGGSWTTMTAVSGLSQYTPTTGVQYASMTVDVPIDATANGLRVNIQTANITNGSSVYIYNIQLEVGGVATPFEQRPYGLELALCQRYYETGFAELLNNTAGAATVGFTTFYKVSKRAIPSTVSLTLGALLNTTSAAFSSYQGSIAAGNYYQFNWTSTAEL